MRMDLLLTPLVQHFLRRFVKRSDEGKGADLKVSLSKRGSLRLHNLELNLDSILPSTGSISVKRAFARQLEGGWLKRGCSSCQ